MFRNANNPYYQYPASSVRMVKGKWYVTISVPAHMRHLFSNRRDIKLSTGTTDLKGAQRKQHDLAQQIYDKFDAARDDAAAKHNTTTDAFALATIYGLATEFKHKDIPDLKPSTNYQQLLNFKNYCDVYSEMVMNAGTKEELNKLATLTALGTHFSKLLTAETGKPNKLEVVVAKSNAAQMGSQYTPKQRGYAGRYRTEIVHNFWSDLLITAAREQGLPEPRIEPFVQGPHDAMILADGKIVPDLHITRSPEITKKFESISRPARVVPKGVVTVSSVMEDYLADMRLKQDSLDTQRKLTRWAKQFLDMMGDMEIAEIKPTHGFEYINKVLSEYPTRANKTLKDYLWGVQNLLKFCRERGYIDINPFVDLDISKYGKTSEQTYPYSREELRTIFAHDWGPQERLLLSILATTGMRPSEAGNMTWERFNDTEHKGIRFLSTLDTDTEQVRVKNQSSRRQVPLHPDLVLPEKSTGRLFNYEKDDVGRCSTEINYRVNPTLHELVPHPNKSIRSLRRTFKVMMRDLGVDEEVHDAITGHGDNKSTSRSNYGGGRFKPQFEAISKLDISFLGSENLR
jgi:integrase